MTASTPPFVDVIAGVLLNHRAIVSEWTYATCNCDVTSRDTAQHAKHQARAVLAAIEQAGGVEWGSRDNDRHRLLWTFDTKEAADKETARHPEHRTTVSRIAGPWTAVVDRG